MTDTTDVTANSDGPAQLQRPAQYPTATRIENGVAYDASGKALGSFDEQQQDQAAQPTDKPAGFNFSFGQQEQAKPAETGGFNFAFGEAQKPEEDGAITRYAKSFNQTLTGAESLADAKNKAMEFLKSNPPAGTENTRFAGEAKIGELAEYLASQAHQGQQHEIDRAVEEAQAGKAQMQQPGITDKISGAARYAGAHIRYAQGVVPLIGPALGAIEDNFAQGKFAEGLGIATALLIPGAAEKFGPGAIESLNSVAGKRAVAQTQRLIQAGKAHEAATTILDSRGKEVQVAAQQADVATNSAVAARDAELAGKGTRQQTIDAENLASQATANARKAKTALEDAQEGHAQAGVEVDRLTRQVSKSLTKVSPKSEAAVAQKKTDIQQAMPSAPKGPASYTPKDLDVALGYLDEHHQNIQEIGSTQEMYDALDHTQKDMENKIKPYVQKYSQEPIATNVHMDVRDALADNPREDFVQKGMAALEPYNLTDPTIAEADDIRAQLNAENRATLKQNFWDIATALQVDPAFAARYHAADSLRNGIYDTFEDKGVKGIRELRQDEASIIKLRNAAQNSIPKGASAIRGSGESGLARKLAAKGAAGAGATMGGGIGAYFGGPVGGAVGAELGYHAGKKLGRTIAPGDLTRDALIERAMKVRGGGVPTTEIEGRGAPSNPPSFPTPPAPSSAMSAQDMQQVQRELSPLHGELATHYGESVHASGYGDLEQRFMDDIEDKKSHGVPLEGPEKQLLGKINQQNAADALAAQQAAQEEALSGKAIGQYNLPESVEPVLQAPSKMPNGMSTQEGLVHDLAHIVVGSERGLSFEDGIRSHLHGENQGEGRLMSAPIDWTGLVDEEGNVDFNKMKARIGDIATTYVAGGVANDLYHGIPYTENHGLGADMDVLKRFMKKAGFSEAEASKMIAQSAEDAATILSRPGMREILEGHASVRETGLADTHHFSPERIEQVLQDLKEGTKREANTGKSSGANAEGNGPATESGAGKEGKSKAGNDEGVSKAGKGRAEGKEGSTGKPAAATGAAEGTGTTESDNPALSERPELTHRVTEKGGEVRFDTEQEGLLKNRGLGKYTLDGTEARVTAANLDKDFRGQGLGVEMYERMAKEAKARGARTLTSDLGGQTSMDAARVWDKLSEKYPGQIQKFANKEGSPGYRWNLESTEERAIRGLKETTTGVPEHDEMIKRAGAIPAGKMGPLSMYHDPTTGSTLATKAGEMSEQVVRDNLSKSRATYAPGRAVEEMKRSGGFTFNPKDGSVPKTGFQVELFPERRFDAGHPPTADEIRAFTQANDDLFKQHPELHVGGYGNELNVSGRFEDQASAVNAAKKLDQISIWDNANQKEIPTGGQNTGAVPADYTQAQRLQELNGVKPENPALSGGVSKTPVTDILREKFEKIDDPLKTAFITKEGDRIGVADHDQALDGIDFEKFYPGEVRGESKRALIQNEGIVRIGTRTSRGGTETYVSVPENMTPEQISQIRQTVAKVGRNGNLVIERADISSDTANSHFAKKEFASPADVEPMLRKIGALGEKPENPALSADRVSTRVPEGKNATENHMEGEPLVIGRQALEASPQKLQDKFAQKAREIPGVKIPKNITDNGKVYDRFVNHVADNLKFLYDKATPEERANNAKWYDSANKLSKDWADQHGITQQQAAGAIAAMSPQMPWDMNVSLSKRIVDTYKNHSDKVVTPEMEAKGREIVANSRNPRAPKANQNLLDILDSGITGKKIGELKGWDRAAAVRLYDEVNNDRGFPRIDPATGNETEPMLNNDGTPASAAWGNLNNVAKALSILDDGSRANISEQVGYSHKVRNFYNNIIDPTNDKDVTIDTHAVGAGTLLPLGGNDKIVTDNFGGAGSSLATGVAGTYPLYADAYRKAAADLGIKPRELQSVTWEKVRELFQPEFKTKENMAEIKSEWKKYTDGKQSIDQTRENIVGLAEAGKQKIEQAAEQAKAKAETKAKAPGRINALDFLAALRQTKNAELPGGGAAALGQQNLFGE